MTDLSQQIKHQTGRLACLDSVPFSAAGVGICTSTAATDPYSTIEVTSSLTDAGLVVVQWQEVTGEVGDDVADVTNHTTITQLRAKRQGYYGLGYKLRGLVQSTGVANPWSNGEMILARPRINGVTNIRALCDRANATFAGQANSFFLDLSMPPIPVYLNAGDYVELTLNWLQSPGVAGTGTRTFKTWHGNMTLEAKF